MSSSRWSKPRLSIANSYKNNDFGYVFHASQKFVEFLFSTGVSVRDLKGKRILDYGCGTGTLARLLALTGARVTGYDPTPECIVEARMIESKLVPPTSLVPNLFTSDWAQVGDDYDMVISVNVLPYLDREQHDTAIQRMIDSLKEGGSCYLWAHKNTHLPLVEVDAIKNQATNMVIIHGTKRNGRIDYYEK
jgi:2-polyprenyl-3-methyl-5-hydroxy-6-metoxy-1,4-benzoquinol methylase